jgi:hypothetical protein
MPYIMIRSPPPSLLFVYLSTFQEFGLYDDKIFYYCIMNWQRCARQWSYSGLFLYTDTFVECSRKPTRMLCALTGFRKSFLQIRSHKITAWGNLALEILSFPYLSFTQFFMEFCLCFSNYLKVIFRENTEDVYSLGWKRNMINEIIIWSVMSSLC